MNVSRETEEKLRLYLVLLEKWQRAVNLVSPKTISEAWTRHFLDSVQIEKLLPQSGKIIFDLGSGAGFPGMVLAIMRPDLEIHLIEADAKKCSFLSTVSRETKTVVHIENIRIENFKSRKSPDVITARALAELKSIFDLTTGHAQTNPDLIFLLSKGETVDAEISRALNDFDFNYKKIKSLTDSAACILEVTRLRAKI